MAMQKHTFISGIKVVMVLGVLIQAQGNDHPHNLGIEHLTEEIIIIIIIIVICLPTEIHLQKKKWLS